MIGRISNLIYAAAIPFRTAKSSEHRWKRWVYRLLAWGIKLSVSGAAMVYIYLRIRRDGVWSDASMPFTMSQLAVFLVPSLALMGLNWGLETVKWHLLIARRYGTHWRTSVKAVLSGTTFGVFTPNRIGEFVGRVLALQPDHRVGGAILSFVNGASQTMSTLTFGIAGLIFLLETLALENLGSVGTRVTELLLVVAWALCLLLYFRMDAIPALVRRTSWLARWSKHMTALREVNTTQLNKLYQLSLIRFVTFIAQYLLVFQLLMGSADWIQVGGAAMLTMFSATLLAFIPIPDLLMREAIALSYFGLFQFDLVIVGEAVFIVWLINVALPAVLGAIILFTYRIFKNA